MPSAECLSLQKQKKVLSELNSSKGSEEYLQAFSNLSELSPQKLQRILYRPSGTQEWQPGMLVQSLGSGGYRVLLHGFPHRLIVIKTGAEIKMVPTKFNELADELMVLQRNFEKHLNTLCARVLA